MPQALKSLSLIQIGSCKNSPIPLLALWGNKNGLPSMKVKKLEKFQNKMGLRGCTWSSLNAQGTETPQSHPYWERRNSPNSQYGGDWGVSVPGAFKLDHLQPFKPILFWNFSNFWLSYPRGQFLYSPGRREIGILPTWVRNRGLSAWGMQTGPFAAL